MSDRTRWIRLFPQAWRRRYSEEVALVLDIYRVNGHLPAWVAMDLVRSSVHTRRYLRRETGATAALGAHAPEQSFVAEEPNEELTLVPLVLLAVVPVALATVVVALVHGLDSGGFGVIALVGGAAVGLECSVVLRDPDMTPIEHREPDQEVDRVRPVDRLHTMREIIRRSERSADDFRTSLQPLLAELVAFKSDLRAREGARASTEETALRLELEALDQGGSVDPVALEALLREVERR